MKTVGIIVEYNPLHNGHLYHIKKTRELSKCDTLICVMSGNFTQRGEPAITDKFTRTEMALKNGVDLVIELPFVFTVQNADIFAYSSVSILNHLGVDEIYFGSENADIESLTELGDILESEAYNKLVKLYMGEGNSYPTAADKAMKDIKPNELFDLPNNILGIQYILAGKKLNSPITFKTIKRTGTQYFDDIKEGTSIQSASGIRKHIFKGETYKNFVPESVYELLEKSDKVNYESFYPQIKYIQSSLSKEDIEKIHNVKEGFENRLKNVKSFESVQDLINKLLTRRYTNSYVKRTLAHLLCQTKKELIQTDRIPYLRILGMNSIGQAHLSKIKHDLEIPLISKVKEGIHPYLDHELKVSKIYSLGLNVDIYKKEFERLIYVVY